MENRNLPQVVILGTGGTIAGRGTSPLQTAGYKAGELSVTELTQAAPGLDQIAQIHCEQICNVASSAITVETWLQMARRINDILQNQPQVSGIVITHGTDTLEETAYFLNLVVKSDKPVVVVGAMRPATAVSPDGPMNLINAVRVAASAEGRGLGVLVVMNDELYASRDVTKTHANQLHTFRSHDLGALGSVDNGKVSVYHLPTRKHTWQTEFDVDQLPTLPRVDIVYTYIGSDHVAVEAFVAAGAKGIILSGAGAGHATPGTRKALCEAQQQGVLVVRATRTGSGRVLPIKPEDLPSADFIGSDTLNAQKARVLLMLALTRSTNPTEIQRMFNTY
jgi:L-asparaginase